jgi:hypothetical protein
MKKSLSQKPTTTPKTKTKQSRAVTVLLKRLLRDGRLGSVRGQPIILMGFGSGSLVAARTTTTLAGIKGSRCTFTFHVLFLWGN